MRPLKLSVCVVALSLVLSPAAQKQEGTRAGRAAIKTATDAGARHIGRRAKPTTIAMLRKMARPTDLAEDNSTAKYQSRRIKPLETSRWKIELNIEQIVKRDDGDFYITARDRTGAKLILESPDPEECRKSPFRKEIAESRALLQRLLHPTTKPQAVNEEAEIVALGFFGRAKDGENGARLQPILHIEFLHIK